MRFHYIHRQIEPFILRLAKQFPALAISGPRQSGKSTLLKELFSKTHRYFSFDDPVAVERASADPQLFLENAGENIVLDEIQYAPQLVSYIKMAIDRMREKKGRFIFTGSQQFLMIKNLGDSLAGRVALLDLLPFHVNEKRRVPELKRVLAATFEAFIHACLRGSYPEMAVDQTIDAEIWYSAYLRTYLERDIRSLYNIGSLREFQNFMQLLAGRTSQILNLSSFASDLGISVNTIKRWISILEASRIIYLLPPYYQNIGKRLTKSPKVYFLDCGLVCYLTGIHDREHLLKGPMGGALFENFCVQETLKTFFFHGSIPRLFYFRSHDGLEVDLVIERRFEEVVLCEIKFTKTPRPQMVQNIERLQRLTPKLRILKGKVLTLSDEVFDLAKGIAAQGLNDYISDLEHQLAAPG